MLGKLLKHEWKATARLVLPLYLVLAVFTLISALILRVEFLPRTGVFVLIQGFLMLGYGLSIAAILLMTLVTQVLRFYKNLMTDEGYLMFTLPVKTHQLITSKLLIAFAWSILSTLAVAASLLAVLGTPANLVQLSAGWQQFQQNSQIMFGMSGSSFVAVMCGGIAVSLVNSILMIYASIALGQLAGKHRVLCSFAAYVVLYTIVQILAMVAIAAMGLPLNNRPMDVTSMASFIHLMMAVSIGLAAALSAVYYWGTQFILKKKLNLE